MVRERWVLIIDDEDGPLGGVALQLVRLGIDAIYSKDLDEAALMGRQNRDRIGAILLHSRIDPDLIDSVVQRVGRYARLGTEAIAVLGARPDPARREALAKKGVHWQLWSPFDEGGLRFIARAPLWSECDENLRIDLRVPTTLTANAALAGERRRALVADLSSGGAYLESPSPFAVGNTVEIELELPEGPLVLPSVVRWANTGVSGPGVRAARPAGMGVEFSSLPAKADIRVREFLHKELRRYRL